VLLAAFRIPSGVRSALSLYSAPCFLFCIFVNAFPPRVPLFPPRFLGKVFFFLSYCCANFLSFRFSDRAFLFFNQLFSGLIFQGPRPAPVHTCFGFLFFFPPNFFSLVGENPRILSPLYPKIFGVTHPLAFPPAVLAPFLFVLWRAFPHAQSSFPPFVAFMPVLSLFGDPHTGSLFPPRVCFLSCLFFQLVVNLTPLVFSPGRTKCCNDLYRFARASSTLFQALFFPPRGLHPANFPDFGSLFF